MDVPQVTEEARAVLALVEEERARVARSLSLLRTLDAGALLLLAEARHQALADLDLRVIKLTRTLATFPTPRPEPLGEVLRAVGTAVASLRQDNLQLAPLLQQGLALVKAYAAALPGAPSIYNRRGQRPADAEIRGRHSRKA